MRIGVLGTGAVGRTLAARFAELGHEVRIGTRAPNETAERDEMAALLQEHPQIDLIASAGVAGGTEMVFNATAGTSSLDALRAAGDLSGTVLVDVANPLDFSGGFPPTLSVVDTDSLAEQIQREFPDAKVVKTLNTVNASVMANPAMVGGADHHMFVCGNDADAKGAVTGLLHALGWKHVVDLGDISMARGLEMYLPLWVRLYGVLGTPNFNIKLVVEP